MLKSVWRVPRHPLYWLGATFAGWFGFTAATDHNRAAAFREEQQFYSSSEHFAEASATMNPYAGAASWLSAWTTFYRLFTWQRRRRKEGRAFILKRPRSAKRAVAFAGGGLAASAIAALGTVLTLGTVMAKAMPEEADLPSRLC